jgi:hypothetical protein
MDTEGSSSQGEGGRHNVRHRVDGWAVATQNSVAPPSVPVNVHRRRMPQPGTHEATGPVLGDLARSEAL